MQEIIEQIMTYLRGIWRYRWYAMVLAWVVSLAGWAYVSRMPDQYEASARVYVNTDSILRPLLRGLAVQTDVRRRVQLLTQTLLSRPNLEKVARMTDQDINAKGPEEMEALLDKLGNNIRLSSTRHEPNLYTISYEYDQPEVAKQVVQAMLTIFVEGSLGEARRDSDVAQKFIGQQILDYEARLVEAENRLTEFKRNNLGLMPGQGGDFFSRLQSAQAEKQQAKLALREAQQRRDEMQMQLEDAEDEQEDSLLSSIDNPLTSPLDARIQTILSKLDEMLLRYTENHPDVKEMRHTVAALEEQKQRELKAVSSSDRAALSGGGSLYQQLKLALNQAEANVAASEVRVKEYSKRVKALKMLMDKQPEVETELKRLNRDYEINKANYNKLLSRRESAKMSEDAERSGDNVKFKVIDPPRVPLTPSGPNRPLFSSLALLLSLGAGLVLSFLMSQIKPPVFDGRVLHQLSGFPVFGTVSKVYTQAEVRNRRLQFTAFLSSGLVLVFVFAGVLVLFGMDVTNPSAVLGMVKGWL